MPGSSPPPRCPICGATGRHVRAGEAECDHCGLVVADDAGWGDLRRQVRRWLLGGATAPGWRLDGHAVRNAAWALGLERSSSGWRRARPRPHDTTLAIMARAAEAERIAEQVAALGFPRTILLFDAPPEARDAFAALCPGTTVLTHPLNGDFAAQRNRLQAAIGTGWLLHLDSDEMPGARLLRALGWLTEGADADGLLALGLPRRNLVDDRLSALYPDIQYRLVRASVRFAGIVHERPVVPFERTSLALAGAIVHHLSGARVRERTRLYGAMAPNGARQGDEAALLRPYRGPPRAAE